MGLDMEDNILKTDANTYIEVMCNCPYCNTYQDIFEDVRECFTDGEPSAQNAQQEITCSNCKKEFIIDNIYY